MSAAGAVPPARAGATYALFDFGTLYGNPTYSLAVNDTGQVAGDSAIAGSPWGQYAFLSGPGGAVLKDLGTLPGGSASVGRAVNASGKIAGTSGISDAAGNSTFHAFLSGPDGGPLKDLGTLPGGIGSDGDGVNASGQVTGSSGFGINAYHAFLSSPDGGPLKDLGTLGGGNSVGYAVNASGQVAGSASISNGATHAFLSSLDGGALKDLGTLPGDGYSIGYAVNASGQVAGGSGTFVNDSNTEHAFLSGPGGGPLTDLGTLGGYDSQANAINASGQVVGFSDTVLGGSPHAFLYSGGQMFDLNDLVGPGSGFTLDEAFGISDNGYITGIGTASSGRSLAFLLIPETAGVPEPSGLVLLGIGAAGLLGYRAWRRGCLRA